MIAMNLIHNKRSINIAREISGLNLLQTLPEHLWLVRHCCGHWRPRSEQGIHAPLREEEHEFLFGSVEDNVPLRLSGGDIEGIDM